MKINSGESLKDVLDLTAGFCGSWLITFFVFSIPGMSLFYKTSIACSFCAIFYLIRERIIKSKLAKLETAIGLRKHKQAEPRVQVPLKPAPSQVPPVRQPAQKFPILNDAVFPDIMEGESWDKMKRQWLETLPAPLDTQTRIREK